MIGLLTHGNELAHGPAAAPGGRSALKAPGGASLRSIAAMPTCCPRQFMHATQEHADVTRSRPSYTIRQNRRMLRVQLGLRDSARSPCCEENDDGNDSCRRY